MVSQPTGTNRPVVVIVTALPGKAHYCQCQQRFAVASERDQICFNYRRLLVLLKSDRTNGPFPPTIALNNRHPGVSTRLLIFFVFS